MRKGKKALLLLTMTACLAFGSEVSAEMTSKGTTGTGAYSTYGTTTNRSGNAGTMSGYGTGTYDTNNYRAYNDNNYRTYATNDNNGIDWGWLGLLGLIGLAGLRGRKAVVRRA
jgi:hypothetical protein